MTPGGNSSNLMSEINVTPFVDVMLVLLIIFMVTAPMMIQGVNVSLPEATSGQLSVDKEQLVISIDKNSRVYINDMPVAFDFLKEKMEKILETRLSREVFLKADKDISYGMVVRVMSELKGAGVEKLGMVTEPVDDKKTSKKS
jgi:biopolymer transport protein TolR